MKVLTALSFLTVLVLAVAQVSVAAEEYGCTLVDERDPRNGRATYHKVCWLIGSDGVAITVATEPPLLYPQLATNVDGTECWYWTTAQTGWVILGRDGTIATIGEEAGSTTVIDTTVDICEGVPGEDLRSVAWEYLRRWLLAQPEVEFSPPATGITGLETYVWADLPDRITATLTSPAGTSLEVRAWVDRVRVDWGDPKASSLLLEEADLGRFVPYPDGSAFHTYETRTCDEEGEGGCYPDPDGYPITVEFRWQAAYRVGGSPWIDIGPVSPSTTLAYPVDEIVTRIDTTG